MKIDKSWFAMAILFGSIFCGMTGHWCMAIMFMVVLFSIGVD